MKIVKLGDVVDLFNGSTPLKTNKNYWVNGDIPWFTVDDLRKQGKYITYTEKFITKLGLKESSISLIPENAVLLCCTASVGAIAINKIRLTTNQQFNALVVKNPEQLLVEFLYYWFLANMDTLKSLGRATTIDYISMTKLRDMTLQLPSLQKQHEIAEKLDRVFAEIDLLEESLGLRDERLNNLLLSLLSEAFIATPDENELGSTSGDQSVVTKLVSLGEVCTVINGGTPNTKNIEFWNGKHAWITPAEMGNLKSPFLNSSKRTLTDEGLGNSSAQLLPEHSVILSSRAPIGHLVINEIPMATNQGCKGLIPNENLNYKYLFYFLYANKQYLNELGSGTTFAEISGSKLKSVLIPILSLEKQRDVVKKLDRAFEEIELLKGQIKVEKDHAAALRQSLLRGAFSQEEAIA